MDALEIVLRRGDQQVELGITAPRVTRSDLGAATYPDRDVAVVVFEANLQALLSDGFAIERTVTRDLRAAIRPLEDGEDRTFVTWDGGEVVRAHVYEADPVTVFDGLLPRVEDAQPFGGFDPAAADAAVLAVHAVRALAAHGIAACPRFGVEVSGPWVDRVLAMPRSLAVRLTHLWLCEPWNGSTGEAYLGPRPLGATFPGLLAFYTPQWAWLRWSKAKFPVLDRLTLGRGPHLIARKKASPPEPPLRDILDRIERSAPAIRHLALQHQHRDAGAIEVIARHPVLRRLSMLDLFGVHHQFAFEALLARRSAFAHLDAIVLGAHLVPQETLAAFEDWPEVVFASWDRREVRAYDDAWAESSALPDPPSREVKPR